MRWIGDRQYFQASIADLAEWIADKRIIMTVLIDDAWIDVSVPMDATTVIACLR